MPDQLGQTVAEQFPEITPEIRNQYPSVSDEDILENYPTLSIERIDACHGLADYLTNAEIQEEKRKSERFVNQVGAKIKQGISFNFLNRKNWKKKQ